jgi:hypothetical protein
MTVDPTARCGTIAACYWLDRDWTHALTSVKFLL